MNINIPEYFQQTSSSDIVRNINGNTIVLLNRKDEIEKAKINITQNVIAFGIHGKKYFHSFNDDTVLYRDEVIFLKKGLCLSTEKVLDENSYKSVLFFFNDDLLVDFFEKNSKYLKYSNTIELTAKTYFKFKSTPILKGYISSLLPYIENENILNETLFKIKLKYLN